MLNPLNSIDKYAQFIAKANTNLTFKALNHNVSKQTTKNVVDYLTFT
jgi:hypothetical protein